MPFPFLRSILVQDSHLGKEGSNVDILPHHTDSFKIMWRVLYSIFFLIICDENADGSSHISCMRYKKKIKDHRCLKLYSLAFRQ